MSNEKRPINEGYSSQKIEKGYKPEQPPPKSNENLDKQGGYVPKHTIDNTANPLNPPSEE